MSRSIVSTRSSPGNRRRRRRAGLRDQRPAGVLLDDLVPGAARQQLLVLLLQPREAGPVDADEPEHLRREAPRRVVAPRVAQEPDARQVLRLERPRRSTGRRRAGRRRNGSACRPCPRACSSNGRTCRALRCSIVRERPRLAARDRSPAAGPRTRPWPAATSRAARRSGRRWFRAAPAASGPAPAGRRARDSSAPASRTWSTTRRAMIAARPSADTTKIATRRDAGACGWPRLTARAPRTAFREAPAGAPRATPTRSTRACVVARCGSSVPRTCRV